jgi:hypothetical protein
VLELEDNDPRTSEDTNYMRVINAVTSSGTDHLPPGDIRRVLSKSSTHCANSTHIKYFIDRGSNGGIAGDDGHIIFRTNRTVDIKGIDNHHVNNIGIGTVGGVVQTYHAPIYLAQQKCFQSFP